MARLIPHATLHVVRGGGHLFILERSAEIAEIVTSYLDRTADGRHEPVTTGSQR
jgi:pimeloyl-ACP methyl ester carboxylesterase